MFKFHDRDGPRGANFLSREMLLSLPIKHINSQPKGVVMKNIATMAAVVTLLLVLCIPCKTLAAAGDTLVVYATTGNLEATINSDTTGAGFQKHAAYKLVTSDTTYVYQGAISVKSDFTIIGVPDPVTGRPPCIQPETLPDNTLPPTLFLLNGENTKAFFKNLYFTGRSTDNTICMTNLNGAGACIQAAAAGIRLTVDHCVFSDWPTNNIAYSGDHTSIFVTNCKFRNGTISTAWYSGEAVRNTNNTAITDSMVIKYNSMYCLDSYAACPVTVNPCTYFEFSHNNVMYTFKNPFWIYNITNGKFNDNMFYAAFAGGSSLTEHFGMWDQLRSFALTSICDLDTLNRGIADWFDPADTAGTGGQPILWPAEALRNIEVKNNVCYWPQVVTQFWTAWDDTAHVDSVVTPVWMNPRTAGFFTDKTHWPKMVESGNLQVDPQFGPAIDQVVQSGVGDGDGFYAHFAAVRTNNPSLVTTYGYTISTVTPGFWVPEWPLPESADMQYANTALKTGGTDGLPIGDPNWFGMTLAVKEKAAGVPVVFGLSQNYPNPFNPTTTIEFALPLTAKVQMKVYNVIGQEVATLVNETLTAGHHAVTFDASRIASGVYMYKIVAGNFVSVKKMVLLK
jgi:Secretion system C-terminal sorting domain